MTSILDSRGKVVLAPNGKPWDGKNPSYILTPEREEFYGQGLLTVTPPVVTKEMALAIDGPIDEKRAEELRCFEQRIAEDNQAKVAAMKTAGVSQHD